MFLKKGKQGNILPKIAIPKSVQEVIPIDKIWDDGIFYYKGRYSKVYRFEDINYETLGTEEKESMFFKYCEVLNSFDSNAITKITVNNRRIDKQKFKGTVLIPKTGNQLDQYRDEYNNMLLEKIRLASNLCREKYITVSIEKETIEEARSYFNRIGAQLSMHFSGMGSFCTELDSIERLKIFHDFFRKGEESDFNLSLYETRRLGHDFKDYICPDSLEFERNCFRMGERFGRVIFLSEYPAFVKDDFLSDMCELNQSLMLSIDILPVSTEQAVRETQKRILSVEKNIYDWQKRQNQNNNFSAVVPYDFELQRAESKEFLDDLVNRDQRMMLALITIIHTADTKEQLDSDTENLLTIARTKICRFSPLYFRQMDGINTALPFGVKNIDASRTLTTESLAVFSPFRAREISQEGGIYYGQNTISKNLILANRKMLLNGNSFILGVSGSGKSFVAKREIVSYILSSDDEIIILDPEREYSKLVKEMGGEVINISANSKNHINAMDMGKGYSEDINPLNLKSEFILSLCEQLMGGERLSAKDKSIIDRCLTICYRDYIKVGFSKLPPTLKDFREELLKQPEEKAKEIALSIELFSDGNLNTFAKQTNVDIDSRIICYDIRDLGRQLLSIGMLIVLDSILNRITANKEKGKNTFIFIDEIYLLFKNEYSANFISSLWKRVRKYGAFCTGITQNVDDLLQSHIARTMLSNSEFIVMLNQAATDRMELCELLNISDGQAKYIKDVPAGSGLLKIGNSMVPFQDNFPKSTKLYGMMTTKFYEM